MATHFDAIVVGSGIGGLSFALNLANRGHSVAIVTKKTSSESNTNWAQGGIACVTDQADDFQSHVQDTLTAGDGLCDLEVVRHIIEAGPARVAELIAWGVEFENGTDGRPDLGREGGHSKRRILHARDMTGRAIESALLRAIARQPKVTMLEHHLAVDLLTNAKLGGCQVGSADDRVYGLHVLNTQVGRVETLAAFTVILATGGMGQVYQFTTNPDIATGDGIAMAYRAGAEVRDMEMVQFHPTALKAPDGSRALISEAVRGEGAVLFDAAGERIMQGVHPQEDLAPRDVVAAAISARMAQNINGVDDHVYLDATHIGERFATRFPFITKACNAAGIDPQHDRIPVAPAAHYTCGGIDSNMDGTTEVEGLYAVGEVAYTGVHGANRLASNSLTESLVVGTRVGRNLAWKMPTRVEPIIDAIDPHAHNTVGLLDDSLRAHVRVTMSKHVGVLRRPEGLQATVDALAVTAEKIDSNTPASRRNFEATNILTVATAVAASALARTESRGCHRRTDTVEARDIWLRHLQVSLRNNQLIIDNLPRESA
jgi:L-aspartate oxidase